LAKILIIENSVELREALIDLLELEGHTALCARNETEAWEQACATSLDLVLQDLSVGAENRFQLLSRLRQSSHTAYIPVIFLTHYLDQAEVRRSYQLGANEVLLKPFETCELLELVHYWTARTWYAADGFALAASL